MSECIRAPPRLLHIRAQTWVALCLTIVICLPAGPARWAEQGIAKASKVSRIQASNTSAEIFVISVRLDGGVDNSNIIVCPSDTLTLRFGKPVKLFCT